MDTIKYIEMEITQPTKVPRAESASDSDSHSDSDSYYEWLSRQERPLSYTLAPDCWKATAWSMPIPITSWENWQRQCMIRSEDIHLPADNTVHYELLQKLMSSGGLWLDGVSLAEGVGLLAKFCNQKTYLGRAGALWKDMMLKRENW